MTKIKTYQDLVVWQVASKFAQDISLILVPQWSLIEQRRLGDQIIRSSRSVPSQIAEGFRKSSLKEKHHYYEMAMTSNDETENHLIEAKNNALIDNGSYKKYLGRVIKTRIMLSRLKKSIRKLATVLENQDRS